MFDPNNAMYVTARVKAFEGRGISSVACWVQRDKTIWVYDWMRKIYTDQHVLCRKAKARIIKRVDELYPWWFKQPNTRSNDSGT